MQRGRHEREILKELQPGLVKKKLHFDEQQLKLRVL